MKALQEPSREQKTTSQDIGPRKIITKVNDADGSEPNRDASKLHVMHSWIWYGDYKNTIYRFLIESKPTELETICASIKLLEESSRWWC